MSRIEINAFGPDGICKRHAEVSNAMAGALTIWNALSRKYGLPFELWKVREASMPIWDACNAGKLSEHDSACVRFTYDNAWVKRENVPRLVEALMTFHRGHVEGTGITPSIRGVAALLTEAAKDESLLGFAFNQTSVCSNPWFSYDEEADTETPYNVLTGSRHWEIFDNWKAAEPTP